MRLLLCTTLVMKTQQALVTKIQNGRYWCDDFALTLMHGPPQFNGFEALFHCTILSVKMQGTVWVSSLVSKSWVMITSMENLCAFVALTGTISCPVMFNHKSLNFNGYTYHWRVIFSTLQNCPTLLYWKHDIFNNFLFMSFSTRNWISGMVGCSKWCLKPLAEFICMSCCLVWKIADLYESSILFLSYCGYYRSVCYS